GREARPLRIHPREPVRVSHSPLPDVYTVRQRTDNPVMPYLVAFVGGLLTIVSPCILPVLPFVFSRAGQSFRRSGVPLLVGMALTFAVVASLAAVTGDWVVRANQLGRGIAMAVFGLLGLSLLIPRVSELLFQPFVRLGAA